MSEKEIKWCPTHCGNTVGYRPQYKDKDGEWRDVPTKRSEVGSGIPASKHRLRLLEDLGLFTYAQAQALAWQCAAYADAEAGVEIEIRARQYEVIYDLKARPVKEKDE